MIDKLVYLGITHKTAPIEVRERAYPDDARLQQLRDKIATTTNGYFLLQTCGRFEIYIDPTSLGMDTIRRSVAMDDYWQVKTGCDAATHLIRVAAGLESQIQGEPQVLGQLKKSYTAALKSKTLSPTLSTLIRHAIHAGKQIRHAMAHAETSPTLANLIGNYLNKYAGGIIQQRILIVGCGNLAHEIAVHITDKTPAQLTITNRRLDRAQSLARKTNAIATTTNNLSNQLTDHDTAIVCTAANQHIITPAMITARTTPLHILDLAVPRNVDPAIAAVANINLTHLDQLPAGQSICNRHRSSIDNIINQTLNRMHQWSTGRRVAQTINQWLASADHPDPRIRKHRRRQLHKPIMMLKKGIAA